MLYIYLYIYILPAESNRVFTGICARAICGSVVVRSASGVRKSRAALLLAHNRQSKRKLPIGHVNDEVTAFAIAQLVGRSPGLVWFDTYNCQGWGSPGYDKRHELVRLLHENLPNPEQSHPSIMQFLPAFTPREQ